MSKCSTSGGKSCAPAVPTVTILTRDCLAVGAEVVLGGAGQWMVSEGTQTGDDSGLVQITVPLQQVITPPVCVGVGVCMYVCVCACISPMSQTYVYFPHVSMHVCASTSMCVCMSMCVCVCVHVFCLAQLMQRIESFKALKRQQVDMANRLEFYSTQHAHRGMHIHASCGLSTQLPCSKTEICFDVTFCEISSF